jgi:hypothetical protein
MVIFYSLLIWLTIFACGQEPQKSPQTTVPPPDDDFVLKTDQDNYSAKYEKTIDGMRVYGFTVIARFENRSQEPAYLDRCRPDTPYPFYSVYAVESREIKESAYNRMWACVGHDNPIVVEPGETRTDNLHFSTSSWRSDTKTYLGALEGQARLIYGIRFCREQPRVDDSGRPVKCKRPETYAQSDIFTVKIEQ